MSAAEQTLDNYVSKLLSIEAVLTRFDWSSSTWKRFKKRHNIQTLTGDKIHVDDVIAGIERERKLKRGN